MSEQKQWHFCQSCSVMYFGGNQANAGVCVAGQPPGNQHMAQGYEFILPLADGPLPPSSQKEWFFCRKCACLFFVAAGGNPGVCVKGGGHDSTGSFPFYLRHDIPAAPSHQRNWRFCRKCSVLFFGGNRGRCVKGGAHDGAGSFDFVLRHSDRFVERPSTIDDGPVHNPVRD